MELDIDIENISIFMPGDIITDEPGLMSGQNTYQENGVIRSSVIGTVQRTNKLIIMNPLRSAYNPQIGDIVVGRVLDIFDKKWRIKINSSSEATLHLNSTFIPQQRQKTEEDEMNMRRLFQENDLLCAEIHSINNDKTVNLHTRNVKYGKLSNGYLVQVDHMLIKKQKHHFSRLKCGIDIIFSHNGQIWLNNQDRSLRDAKELNQDQSYTIAQRINLAKTSNILKMLNRQGTDISIEMLDDLFEITTNHKISAIELLDSDNLGPLQEHIAVKQQEKREEQLRKLEKNVNVLQE